MVMASAGVNVPGGSDGGGNPASAATAAAAECEQARRRRLVRRRRIEELHQQAGSSGSGSGSADATAGVRRRLQPFPSRFGFSPSPSPSSTSQSPSPSPSQAGAAGGGSSSASADRTADDEPEQQQQADPVPAAALEPPAAVPAAAAEQEVVWPAAAFGTLSIAGRMRAMEDTISVHPDLYTWPAADGGGGSPMHFFAVFDGHGGPHVSALCRDRMHQIVAEELAKESATFLRRRHQSFAAAESSSSSAAAATTTAAAAAAGPGWPWLEAAEEERAWRTALHRSFRRVDALSSLACACGRVSSPRCRCPLAASGSSSPPPYSYSYPAAAAGVVGSTAVVALLVRGRLVVANCGDSRAVLCRGAHGAPPVPLSDDHKPNRPDERARIEATGGRVLYNNGYRVRGILAMSRALGDRMLRPEVIAIPEITITQRTVEDECLILASDGMWDVISNEVACDVARNCLEDGIGNAPPNDAAAAAAGEAPAAGGGGGHEAVAEQYRCVRAAALLGRLALGRNTQDNVSIIVIDLKHRAGGGE